MTQGSKPIWIRWARASLFVVATLAFLAVCGFSVGPAVWATPLQNPLRQTVPTLTPTPLPNWIWIGQAVSGPPDYAPSGMPDFDQKQATWHDPADAAVWTHCGPVAAADALWWLDSRFEPGHVAPPAISDGYALIGTNGTWDDHDPQNVAPLVDDLASRLDTNGVRSGASALGTDAAALLPALQAYLAEKGLATRFSTTWAVSPTLEQMSAWVRRGDGVVLHMSFWEDQGDGAWVYVGGHYVTLAGLDPVNRMLAISDPYGDAFESGEATLGRSPVMHPFLHMADVHNDARYVSQDVYHVVEVAGSGGVLALDGYPFGRAFIDQNLASEFEAERGPYGGGPLQARLSYAWSLSRHQLYLPLIFKRVR